MGSKGSRILVFDCDGHGRHKFSLCDMIVVYYIDAVPMVSLYS
jgi:hypothetical protein